MRLGFGTGALKPRSGFKSAFGRITGVVTVIRCHSSKQDIPQDRLKQDQNRLSQTLQGKEAREGWDNAWNEKVTPWEMGKENPVLQHIVRMPLFSSMPSSATVLIPGCGSGYDVLTWAQSGKKVIGLEISETAAKIARNTIRHLDPQQVTIEVVDFFHYVPKPRPFDIIYDYTFLCALPPDLRNSWASKICQLLTDNGLLVSVLFPLGDFQGGPPYAVNAELLKNLFKPHPLKEIISKTTEHSVPARRGREWLSVWQKHVGE